MKQLNISDLENIRLGCSILGSGGGGDPGYACMMLGNLMEKTGPIRIKNVKDITTDDFVVPLTVIGAPLIAMERLMSGNEFETILKEISTVLGKKPTALMAAEIGGANCFTPLIAAAKSGLPVVDADMIGRAFPELQMSSCFLKNLPPAPAVIADCLGNTAVLKTADAKMLEKMGRALAVAAGSSCAAAFYMMEGKDLQGSVLEGSLSNAIEMGKLLKRAGEQQLDPVKLLEKQFKAVLLGSGALYDIEQSVVNGFLKGKASLLCEGKKITVCFQNEYLLAKSEEGIISATPDLLVLIDKVSGSPILSESLRYGLQVDLIKIPAPPIWKTPAGMELVGPKQFYSQEELCQ